MKKTMMVALAAVMAAGCTKTYVKEDGTPLAERDRLECEYEAEKATASSGSYFSLTRPSSMGQAALLRDKCLELRGYKVDYVKGGG